MYSFNRLVHLYLEFIYEGSSKKKENIQIKNIFLKSVLLFLVYFKDNLKIPRSFVKLLCDCLKRYTNKKAELD